MSSKTVTGYGFGETIAYLEKLGSEGDAIAREASTAAANELRDNWLVRQISGQTGISTGLVRKGLVVKKANNKYPNARINFSGSGVLVRDYSYRVRRTSNPTRAQIVVDWIGGQKLAAGFVNPLGSGRVPLSTRNSKTTKNGKTYTYRKGKMADAMGPSLAAAYLALPENEVAEQAARRLADRLITLLDAIE